MKTSTELAEAKEGQKLPVDRPSFLHTETAAFPLSLMLLASIFFFLYIYIISE